MDWTGDTNSVMKALGASNHSDTVREQNDYYATDPKMVEALLKVETFDKYIWEPACGEGHIAKVLEAHGYDVSSSDLIYRGYGDAEPYDFLKHNDYLYDMDIITNPPYKYALEFVEKALASISEGHKVAMLLKLQFLEGQKRRRLFDKNPPQTVYIFSERQECAKNGEFTGKSAVAYAWFIWRKGYYGPTYLKWI